MWEALITGKPLKFPNVVRVLVHKVHFPPSFHEGLNDAFCFLTIDWKKGTKKNLRGGFVEERKLLFKKKFSKK